MNKPLKNPRSIAAIFSCIYLLIILLITTFSPSIGAIFFITFAIVLVLEPWSKFLKRILGFSRTLSINIGLVAFFVGIIVLAVYLIPLVFKEATNFYNTALDFFPSDQKTPVTLFEINNNVDRIMANETFVSRLSETEKIELTKLNDDIKEYYREIYEQVQLNEVDIPETIKEIIPAEKDYIIVFSGTGTKREATIEELSGIISAYLTPANSEYLGNQLLEDATRVGSKEIWREVVEYFMPKPLAEERTQQITNNVGKLLIEMQSMFRQYIPRALEKIPNLLTTVFTVMFFVIIGGVYFSYYFPAFKSYAPKLYPKKCRNTALPFLKDTYGNLERYVISIVIVGIVVGIIMGILVKLLGLPYALLMGFWAALTNLIPIVGVVLEIVPLLLVAASVKSLTAFIGLIIGLILIHSMAFIMFLKLMKGYNRINPVVVIIMLILVGQFLGIGGAFIAVPIAIVLKQIWNHFLSPWLEES